jgi:hypothetical protein
MYHGCKSIVALSRITNHPIAALLLLSCSPVSAPLADPTAIPAEEYTAAGDMALRHVAHALLVGVDAKQASPQALQVCRGDEMKPGYMLVVVFML